LSGYTVAEAAQRTERVFAFIKWMIDEKGYSPTLREIMDNCAISSTSVASYQVQKLIRNGKLIDTGEGYRSMKLSGYEHGKYTDVVRLARTLSDGKGDETTWQELRNALADLG